MNPLKKYLADTGTTQTAMAAKLGISQPYLHTIIHDRANISLKFAVEIDKKTFGAVPVTSWASCFDPLPVNDA